MPGPKDSFSPTMFLEHADATVAGSYEAPQTPGEGGKSSVPEARDSTSNIVGATTTKHNTEIPRGDGGQSTAIPGKFDPINLTPGAKHPHASKFDHSAQ